MVLNELRCIFKVVSSLGNVSSQVSRQEETGESWYSEKVVLYLAPNEIATDSNKRSSGCQEIRLGMLPGSPLNHLCGWGRSRPMVCCKKRGCFGFV